MKCIDAVEGTVKCILNQLHSAHEQSSMDDSEYISRVKTIIDATDQYIQNNPELFEDPAILRQVLYVHSRNLWLFGQKDDEMTPFDNSESVFSENDDYQTYYYDYLYERGVYPS